MANRWRSSENSDRYFLGLQNRCRWWLQQAVPAPSKKSYDKPRQFIKKQSYHFANKVAYSENMAYPVVMHVQMWELDHKEGWVWKNWCFQTVVLEKTLESPLDNKEIKSVNPKGNQPWIFIGRIDAEAEAPILWSPDVKSWITGKNWCWKWLKA